MAASRPTDEKLHDDIETSSDCPGPIDKELKPTENINAGSNQDHSLVGKRPQSQSEREQFLRKKLETEGPKETKRYIEKQLNRWKEETLQIAITGKSATGKSTLINKIRGVQPGDKGFAKSGSGDTTAIKQKYVHPTNKQITFWDCPGVGTLKKTKDKFFLEDVNLELFDYFMICFNGVLSEDDAWLADHFVKAKKPFCLVRTMLDLDITNEKYNRPKREIRNEKTIVESIRQKAMDSIAAVQNEDIRKALQEADVFVISSRNPEIGEINSLLKHMEHELPYHKYEAFMLTLPVITREVIEQKYITLQEGILLVSVKAATFSAIPIPFVDIPFINWLVEDEVQHYLEVFGLNRDDIKKIPGIKSAVGMNSVKQFVAQGLKAVASVGAVVRVAIFKEVAAFSIPVLGSVMSAGTTFGLVYTFLNKTLNEFKEDAETVYQYQSEQGKMFC